MTPGLTDFLQDRLDEDEAAAKACQSPPPWKAADHESDTWIVTDGGGEPLIYDEGTPSLEEARHIARHDPGRVLREVKAKRAILRAEMDRALGGVLGYSSVLLDLASIYSDHPDYRQEWKP